VSAAAERTKRAESLTASRSRRQSTDQPPSGRPSIDAGAPGPGSRRASMDVLASGAQAQAQALASGPSTSGHEDFRARSALIMEAVMRANPAVRWRTAVFGWGGGGGEAAACAARACACWRLPPRALACCRLPIT